MEEKRLPPETFINQLLQACSGIDGMWQAHQNFWQDEEPGYYNDIAIIVDYIINKYQAAEFEDFSALSEVIERGLELGDDETSELAYLGVLEGILLVGSHNNIRSEDHRFWLGDSAFESLKELEAYFQALPAKLAELEPKRNVLSKCFSARTFYIALTCVTIVLGLLSRSDVLTLPILFKTYGGDTLWGLMVFWLFRAALPSLALWQSVIMAVCFSFTIEFSQFYQAPWLNEIRATTLGGLVLGFGFKPSDLVCYFTGAMMGCGLNYLFIRTGAVRK